MEVAAWLFSVGRLENGGDHRASQIHELLVRGGRAIAFDSRMDLKLGQIFWESVKSTILSRSFPPWFTSNWRLAIRNGIVISRFLRRKDKWDCIVLEATAEATTARLLRPLARKLILAPQNIESLGAQRKDSVIENLNALKRETTAYAKGDAIFTISDDEMWLLRLIGLNAYCLPYYPCKQLELRLDAIRKKRLSTPKSESFLVLGTMGNPPTKDGTIELLDQLSGFYELGGLMTGAEVLVAGNGTEILEDYPHPDFVKICGRISDEQLDSIRNKCKALIVHQRVTTGLITRIQEAVVAGIPVLANIHAARGYGRLSGVHTYNCIEQLFDLMNRTLATPSKPPRPDYEEGIFLNAVFGHHELAHQ